MGSTTLPDREYLVRAFNKIRPFYWGDDLDAVLNHSIRRNAVIAVARRMQRSGEPPSYTEPVKLRHCSSPIPPSKQRPLDRKQLASGEREDD